MKEEEQTLINESFQTLMKKKKTNEQKNCNLFYEK